MKITDELKKQFNRFNAYLLSTKAEDGLCWDYYIYDVDSVEYGHGPYVSNDYGFKIDLSKFTTEVKILEEILEHKLNEIDFDDYLGCGNCNGNGHLQITYDPSESVLNFDLTVNTIDTETYDNKIPFSKLASEQSQYTWRNYEYLKLFGDQEKINEWKEEYGDYITVTYDGYGDSGQINEYEYSQQLDRLLRQRLPGEREPSGEDAAGIHRDGQGAPRQDELRFRRAGLGGAPHRRDAQAGGGHRHFYLDGTCTYRQSSGNILKRDLARGPETFN